MYQGLVAGSLVIDMSVPTRDPIRVSRRDALPARARTPHPLAGLLGASRGRRARLTRGLAGGWSGPQAQQNT
jgi:hypothetical protein